MERRSRGRAILTIHTDTTLTMYQQQERQRGIDMSSVETVRHVFERGDVLEAEAGQS